MGENLTSRKCIICDVTLTEENVDEIYDDFCKTHGESQRFWEDFEQGNSHE